MATTSFSCASVSHARLLGDTAIRQDSLLLKVELCALPSPLRGGDGGGGKDMGSPLLLHPTPNPSPSRGGGIRLCPPRGPRSPEFRARTGPAAASASARPRGSRCPENRESCPGPRPPACRLASRTSPDAVTTRPSTPSMRPTAISDARRCAGQERRRQRHGGGIARVAGRRAERNGVTEARVQQRRIHAAVHDPERVQVLRPDRQLDLAVGLAPHARAVADQPAIAAAPGSAGRFGPASCAC